jgi:STE24 endopeptidase
VTGLFVWIPYALIAKSPRRWWFYSAGALIPVVFLILVAIPVWISPLTTNYRPLPDTSLAAKIESLAARCGVTHIPVFVGGDDDAVVGLGPTNRIILDKDIFKN